MSKSRNRFIPALSLLLIAALTSSCTVAARKGRLARRADEYFKAADYDKAKIEYTNLLRIDPREPLPYERMGIMWMEEGAPLRAGPFLLRAKELAPTRAEVKTKLGQVYIAVGGLVEARREAEEALQVDPGNEEAILIMTDTARTPDEIAVVQQLLEGSKRNETMNYHLAVATLALRRNDPAGLEAGLQKAIAADPKSPTGHMAMARYALAKRQNDEARKEFKIAAELAPPRNTAHLLWAEFLAQTNARDEAVSYLNGIVKKAPDFLPAWTLLAKYAATKNYDEALTLLDNVFRRDAQNFDARMLESEFYMSKGDPKKAIDVVRGLDSTYPKIPIIKYQLGRSFLLSGDTVSAATALEQAIAISPNYDDAILLLGEVNLRAGNPGPVVGAMEVLLKTTRNVERAEVLLADAYRAMGRFDDAAGLLRKQIATTPEKAEPYLLLGVLLRQQNKLEEARQVLEKAVELGPDKLSAINQLVELDILANDHATALRRVAKLLEKSPDSAGLHMLAGKIYAAQRDWDRAEAALRKVVELNADIPAAYELLVSVYVAANKLPQAVKELESFLAKTPSSPGAVMTLALIYDSTKEYEKARDAYEKLLVLRPDYPPALNNLAYIYSEKLPQLERAAELARRAHNQQPGEPAVADTLGWILYKLGDYQQAVAMLEEAVAKLSGVPEVQFHLGMANYMMGHTEAARAALQKAVDAGTDFAGKDEAQKRLALLAQGISGSPGVPVAEGNQQANQQQSSDVVSLVRAGEAYEKQGDIAKAAETFEQALKANPKLVPATLKLAQFYAGPLNNKSKALEYAKKARELAPSDPEVARVLGRIAFQTGNWSWAYGLLQESARRMPDNGGIQYDYAWAAYGVGKIPEAQQAMQRVITIAPTTPEGEDAKSFLAMLDAENKLAPDSSIADAEKLLSAKPDYVPALMVQARSQMLRGNAKSAEEIYNHILRSLPEFAPAQRELARILSADPANSSKSYDLAVKARKTLTDDADLNLILGTISYQKKDYAQAIQALQQSARKKPLDAEAQFYLGMSQMNGRQQSQGRQTLEQALAAGLTSPHADEARGVLEEKK